MELYIIGQRPTTMRKAIEAAKEYENRKRWGHMTFDRNTKLKNYMAKFNIFAILQLATSLRGDARKAISDIYSNSNLQFNELVSRLEEQFKPKTVTTNTNIT